MDRRLALAGGLALLPACLHGQRAAVLKQVDVPHAYYWREMYVPQVTSGPSAVTWSPDGRELIYAMQGSLWRQPVGAGAAHQPPPGGGDVSPPACSPGGRCAPYPSGAGAPG